MKIICFGDSNTYGYDPRGYLGGQYDHPWPEILAEKLGYTVLNWGENGRQIPVAAVAFPADTDLLTIMLGTNDLLQLLTPKAVCEKMERFLKSLTLERNKILLIAPPPMKLGQWVQDQELIIRSEDLANSYKALTERLGIRFADAGEWNIPLAYDGVHLTEEAHKAFAMGLINYFNKEKKDAGNWNESAGFFPVR